jgi:hypothetical protein
VILNDVAFVKSVVGRMTNVFPGFKMEVEDDGRVVVTGRWPDSCEEGHPVKEWRYHGDVYWEGLDIARDEAEAEKVVVDSLFQLWAESYMHEIQEGLHLDGNKIYNPHNHDVVVTVVCPSAYTTPQANKALEDYYEEREAAKS